MSIISTERLTFITHKKTKFDIFDNLLTEARTDSRKLAATSIYMCYSPEDLEWVTKAVVMLRGLRVRIAVDWLDPVVSPFESAETAADIKRRIRENDRFILLATEHALASPACNWALGYADSEKARKKIALLPVTEKKGEWNGGGYTQVYQRIEEGAFGNENFKIITPEGADMTVAEWLKS